MSRSLKIITMTAFRRPAYTSEVLSALARCTGISDWLFLPSVEPGNEDVIELFRQWDASESQLTINDYRLGLNRNTKAALIRAYEMEATHVVHFEDDTVPSSDALQFFEWAIDTLERSDPRLETVIASGYNNPATEPDDPFAVRRRRIWTPWGWAVDRQRLAWLLSQWCVRNPKCFTCRIRQKFQATRREIYPVLSRTQNIGYELGENGRTPEWYRANHRSRWVAGDLPRGEFHCLASP